MKKLIKPKSRERMRSLTLTPSRSEYGDGFLMFPQDSQDSSSIGSGSNSLDDTLTQKRSGSEYKENTSKYRCGPNIQKNVQLLKGRCNTVFILNQVYYEHSSLTNNNTILR